LFQREIMQQDLRLRSWELAVRLVLVVVVVEKYKSCGKVSLNLSTWNRGFEGLNESSCLGLLCINVLCLRQERCVARRRDERLAICNLARGSATSLFDFRASKGGENSLWQEVNKEDKEK
jgi:hypothetical protein